MKLLEIVQEYEIISSTQTGLKLTIDFNEAIGQTPAPVQTGLRQGYKKKQKVKPTRIPLYSKEWSHDLFLTGPWDDATSFMVPMARACAGSQPSVIRERRMFLNMT